MSGRPKGLVVPLAPPSLSQSGLAGGVALSDLAQDCSGFRLVDRRLIGGSTPLSCRDLAGSIHIPWPSLLCSHTDLRNDNTGYCGGDTGALFLVFPSIGKARSSLQIWLSNSKVEKKAPHSSS